MFWGSIIFEREGRARLVSCCLSELGLDLKVEGERLKYYRTLRLVGVGSGYIWCGGGGWSVCS